MISIKKILFPTDFSENSNHASDYAVDLAQKLGARLYILHVIHELIDTTGFYIPNISLDQLQKDLEQGAEEMMNKFCREKMGDFRDYESTSVIGLPHIEILNMAKEKGVDIIVMGTHGRTGIDRVLFGSTAEKVVKKAPCPVLTVRKP